MIVREIETTLDSFQLFAAFKEEAYPYFLDSGMNKGGLGKYSFIGSNPFRIFKAKNETLMWIEKDQCKEGVGNPFEALKELYHQYHQPYKSFLPFIGGMVGFFGYDLCHHIEKFHRTTLDDVKIPDLYLGFYDGGLVIDHEENKVYITDAGVREGAEERVEWLQKTINAFEKNPKPIETSYHQEPATFEQNLTKEQYQKAIQDVKAYIRSGDIYQANMTRRFQTKLRDHPIELYKKLRDINPAPFASYIDFGEGHIVSSSPERFISLREGIIETRPIKGTCPRGKTEEEDQANYEALSQSEKDRSELLMIVDLERNDLSKIAKVGTVKVPELFVIEKYATVFHLVATVRAELEEGTDPIDCLKATFPGGSITGAPKIRAMEIIDELEPTQRNLYTGSIGYIGFNGDMDLNIVIRTIVCKDDKAYFQVGGGIVWDSDPEGEYQESMDKAKALMEALRH